MTNVEILKSKADGQYLGISVQGHSGYSEEGSDIVCSAVSFMTINTVNSLIEITKDEPKVEQDEALALIKCSFLIPLSSEGNVLLKAFELGMKQISDKNGLYGKYVNLSIKEV